MGSWTVGRRARARIKAGGPSSVHRAALPWDEYRALVAYVKKREGWKCLRCRRPRHLDPHHIVKRSLGGADDPSNIVALCRPCHDQTDWPTDKGRLVILAFGSERFRYIVVTTSELADVDYRP